MRYKDGLGAEVEPAAASLYLRLGPKGGRAVSLGKRQRLIHAGLKRIEAARR
jgi:hypothetical protein